MKGIFVRLFSPRFGLAAFGLFSLIVLLVVGVFVAAPSDAPAPFPEIKPENIVIAPHHAVYKVKTAALKNGSSISGVNGRLEFEWRDVCDGWAIQQHTQLHFSYVDDDDQSFSSAELSWESKDGKKYQFNSSRTMSGQEADSYKGKAVQNKNGSVTVNYTLPKDSKVELPAGTLFPSAHTLLLLKKAAAQNMTGEKLFMVRVFDGSDDMGVNEISAFLFPPRADDVELNDKIKDDPLVKAPGWPVHLAFFKPGTENGGEPDYEMDLILLANGVAKQIRIDYGDYAVLAVLEAIKPIEARGCP